MISGNYDAFVNDVKSIHISILKKASFPNIRKVLNNIDPTLVTQFDTLISQVSTKSKTIINLMRGDEVF